MSQIIHGPPKMWGPGQLPDLPPPLKPALSVYTVCIVYTVYHVSVKCL